MVWLASLLPPAPPAENGLHGNGKIPHKTSKAMSKTKKLALFGSPLSPGLELEVPEKEHVNEEWRRPHFWEL